MTNAALIQIIQRAAPAVVAAAPSKRRRTLGGAGTDGPWSCV
jgi:hypothetical protein